MTPVVKVKNMYEQMDNFNRDGHYKKESNGTLKNTHTHSNRNE